MLNKRFVAKTVLIIGVVCLVSVPVFAEDLEAVPTTTTVDPLDLIQQRVNENAILQNAGVDNVPEEYQNLSADQIRDIIARLEAEQLADEQNGVNDEEKEKKRKGDLSVLNGLLGGLLGGGGGGNTGGGGNCPNCVGGGGQAPLPQPVSVSQKTTDASSGPMDAAAEAVTRTEKSFDVNTETGEITEGELVSAFVGDSDPLAEFSGAQNSPVLFWPETEPGGPRKRTQMSLGMHESGAFLQNLSVDDELFKTSWSQFQSKDYIQRSFMQDQSARDRYLDSFDSARGVAHLTLSYLDKTVAAGLSTVQQQADMDYTHQLLKQVSWSTARVANPTRDHMFVDIDEKFEACMMTNAASLKGNAILVKDDKARFVSEHIKTSLSSCDEKCAPVANKQNSPYHYCVCCAENASIINTSLASSGANAKISCGQGKDCYSLVERVFVGLKMPTGARQVGFSGDQYSLDAAEALANFTSQFRALYGDMLMVPFQESKGDFKQVLIHPYLPPSTWIKAIRDFKTVSASHGALKSCESKQYGGNVSVQYCPFLSQNLEEGICPALKGLVGLRKDHEKWNNWRVSKSAKLVTLLSQASGGGVLDVRTLYALADMDPLPITQTGTVKISNPQQVAAINTVCDQASIGYFKSVHLKMVSVVLDHLLLNQKVTQREREQVFTLMNRVSQYLDLAAQDDNSYVRALLAGLDAEASTNNAVEGQAFGAQILAQQSNNTNLGMGAFGGGGFSGPSTDGQV